MTATAQDIDTLARTLYGEARGESTLGRAAVASVILNRIARPRWWGRTVHGVCRKKWQFSCWLENDPNFATLRAVTKANPLFRDCLVVAELACAGLLGDSTKGATHYHAPSVKPRWARGKKPCVVIGAHSFYNNIARK